VGQDKGKHKGAPDLAQTISARMDTASIYAILGIQLLSAERGAVELEVTCGARHANVDGAVHGGFLCLVADTAMGFAVRSGIDRSWQNRTMNLSIDWFIGARIGDRIRARAKVDHATPRFRWASVELLSDEGRVICKAHSLNSVRPPESTG
jgi:uncharacterized protein (TIGR00369 family)